MTRKPLEPNTRITLYDSDMNETKYVIDAWPDGEAARAGGSCFVYRAKKSESEDTNMSRTFIVKELYPEELGGVSDYSERNDDGSIRIFVEYKEKYKNEKARFIKSVRRQQEFFEEEPANTTLYQEGVYTDKSGGTLYSVMNLSKGETLAEAKANDRIKKLSDVASVISQLAHVVGMYHNEGYLHLDIKPSNLFWHTELGLDRYRLSMFDFNTVEKIDIVQSGGLGYCTESPGFTAPEQVRGAYRDMGSATDLFSIGAVLYWLLTGREVNIIKDTVFRSGPWGMESESGLFTAADPRCVRLTERILDKTLHINPAERYASTEDLLKDLERLLDYSGRLVYLRLSNVLPNPNFVGREKEMRELSSLLDNNGYAIVSGVGGIGKSDLVREFAMGRNSRYDTVCFMRYSDSIIKTFALGTPLENFAREEREGDEPYFRRILERIDELGYGKETLIVIDGMDEYHDEGSGKVVPYAFTEGNPWYDVAKLNADVLFTTRNSMREMTEIPGIDLKPLTPEEQKFLFHTYYRKDPEGRYKEQVEKILKTIGGHTLLIVLVAKILQTSFTIDPEDILRKLEGSTVSATGKGVRNMKDGHITEGDIDEHIKNLFDLTGVLKDGEQSEVLRNMTLVPVEGIDAVMFLEWTGAEESGLDVLINSGWVTDNGMNTVSLHPVISDLAAETLKPDIENCEKYLYALYTFIYPYYNDGIKIWRRNICFGEAALRRVDAEEVAVALLMDVIGINNAHSGLYENARRHYMNAMPIIEKKLGKNNINAAHVYEKMGITYRDTGNPEEALVWLMKASSIFEEKLGKDHSDTSNIYTDIVSVYISIGNYEKALEWQMKASSIHDEKHDKDQLDTADIFHIGLKCFLMGNPEEALEWYMKLLLICEDQVGKDQLITAMVYIIISSTYYAMDNDEEALKWCMKALLIYEEKIGKDHPDTVEMYSDIADVYEKLGDTESADEWRMKADSASNHP
jgi:serine/threonine protein kinase/tetratricopeptide (TPR) repeat protein